jgi:hypothetical protein
LSLNNICQFQRFADPSSEKVPFFVCIELTSSCFYEWKKNKKTPLVFDKQSKLEKAQTGEQMRARVYAYSPDYLNGWLE